MKRFIRKTALFVAPLLLLLYPMDYFFSKSLKETSMAQGEYEVWNDIFNGSVNADVAIYGSSRAWVHINPEILEDSLNRAAYNLGIDGQNLWMQTLRHQQYLAHNPYPEMIVHSLDVFTLEPRINDYNNYNNDQFLPYLFWHDYFEDTDLLPPIYDKYDHCVPMLRYQNRGMRVLLSMIPHYKKGPLRTRGLCCHEATWNTDFDKAREERGSYEVVIDSATVALFREYLADCQQKNIQVVLVYSPEYIEGQHFVSNRQELFTLLNDIATEFNLPFLDYSSHEMCLNRSYFYNAIHLNATGANHFSRILAHDLKPLL
jgi:hypothetical protein